MKKNQKPFILTKKELDSLYNFLATALERFDVDEQEIEQEFGAENYKVIDGLMTRLSKL